MRHLQFLPRPVARVVALELLLWVCLGRWVLRRSRPGPDDVPYHRRSIVGVLLVVVVVTLPVEALAFGLLIPWAWLRWLLLIASVYALFWAFGFYASLVGLPHRLESTGVRLRYGTLAEAQIPYAEIDRVEMERRRTPGGGEGLRVEPGEEVAYLSIGGVTHLAIWLRTPRSMRGFLRPTRSVRTLHVAADQPERLAEELARRIRPLAESTGGAPVRLAASGDRDPEGGATGS